MKTFRNGDKVKYNSLRGTFIGYHPTRKTNGVPLGVVLVDDQYAQWAMQGVEEDINREPRVIYANFSTADGKPFVYSYPVDNTAKFVEVLDE